MRFRTIAPLATLELDLDPRLTVTGASMDGAALKVERAANKVRIALPETLGTGTTATVTVAYAGAPYVAERAPCQRGPRFDRIRKIA